MHVVLEFFAYATPIRQDSGCVRTTVEVFEWLGKIGS